MSYQENDKQRLLRIKSLVNTYEEKKVYSEKLISDIKFLLNLIDESDNNKKYYYEDWDARCWGISED